ncbi:DUF7576 family protein [Natrinema salsiterrestre]|uniref:Small CPxCG-related zinc finger protein n=1 Tax=Natrinema salsiterrestre TaxID=2950540 RepID=A0A9Q4Q0S6_9EURY|nr:hypothetical protein [Natrinema salsiterrestre]MDF9746925.1 hypothetical protein [Natrinema salsiterrestre]
MSDRPERATCDTVEECAVCGDRIPVNDWHIATTDEETEIHSFCSEECRDDWTE